MSERLTRISQKLVLYNKEGQILALRRTSSAPSHPLTWDLPGGELEYGEDPEKGVLRELEEETGIKVPSADIFDVEAHVDSDDKEFWVTLGWRAHAENQQVKLSFEHDKYAWVTKEEFSELEAEDKKKRFVEKS